MTIHVIATINYTSAEVLQVEQLPPELMELVAGAAGRGDARTTAALLATSSTQRRALLAASGASTVFEALALASIEALPDLKARMRFVNHVAAAGLHAELFVWPPSEPSPLPSPLREHVCQWDGPPAYSLPLEHNLMVSVTPPLDAAAWRSGLLTRINLWGLHGRMWIPGEEVKSLHLNLFAPPYQYSLGGATESASNVNFNNDPQHHYSGLQLQCCRRMQIVLRKWV